MSKLRVSRNVAEVRNTFITGRTDTYIGGGKEVKKILIVSNDEVSFKELYLAYIKLTFDLNLTETKVLGELIEIVSDTLIFYKTEAIQKYLGEQTNICTGCASNAISSLVDKKLIRSLGMTKYKLSPKFFMKLIKGNLNLIIEITNNNEKSL